MNRRVLAGVGTAALLGLVWLGPAMAQDAPIIAQTRARIEGLKAERARLQEELRSSLSDDARLKDAPPGAVLIGVPATLVEAIVSEALTGPLRNVRLTLKDVVKVERKDTIRAKTFLGMMTLGHYALTVNVREVVAVMRPKTPTLAFGGNRVAIDLPVSVESGAVKASLLFSWDGRKLAGAVCGDLTSEHDLRATVPPTAARLRGRFDLEARGERLIVKPAIAPIELAFKIEPRQQTWDFIDELIESKNAVCEAALRKAAVGQKVKDLVARGFKVRVPNNWLHEMTLPASFRDTVDVKGASAGFAITPAGVSVTKTRVWYGADLALRREASAKSAATPRPSTAARE
jgi:hypothetical protein